jgi:hypothetical protein
LVEVGADLKAERLLFLVVLVEADKVEGVLEPREMSEQLEQLAKDTKVVVAGTKMLLTAVAVEAVRPNLVKILEQIRVETEEEGDHP